MSKNSNHPIIVISIQDDAHIPYVQKHLYEQLIVVDTSLNSNNSLTIQQSTESGSVYYRNIEIKNPKSIWYRKPAQVYNEQLNVAAKDFNYCKSSIENLRASLYTLFPEALWVSDYYAIWRAMNKPAQLNVARKLGFNIPDTLFTNDGTVAKAFIKKYKTCVMKQLADVRPLNEHGKALVFLTQQITNQEKIDFSSLYLSPVIFQQEIDAVRELRITVVDTKVFAASIVTKGLYNSSIRDYKEVYVKPHADLIIEPYTLPSDVRDICIAHAKAFNLQFSAIDLLEDKNGKFWFLENNPNGQWAFIEDATEQQIGKTIAELLIQGK